MAHTVLVAPAGSGAGLTTVCLGLVRALDRQGVRVGFAKPIAGHGKNPAAQLMRLGARIDPPDSLPRAMVEQLLAAGDEGTLMEQVVALCHRAAVGCDVLVVVGMAAESGMVYSTRVNGLMMRALDAELVLVGAPNEQTPEQAAEALAIAARGYGSLAEGPPVSCVLNRVCLGPARGASKDELQGALAGECGECRGALLSATDAQAYRDALTGEGLRPIAVVPCHRDLGAPRVMDVARALGATVVREGDASQRRVRDVILCAMTVANAIKAFQPGVLVIVPGDRNDIVLAVALAVQGGMPIAGLLLTGGLYPDEQVLAFCKPALDTGLPMLSVEDGSYTAATRVESMNPEIPEDDATRVELAMNYVADRLEPGWLSGLTRNVRAPRLSPPAFRHRLVGAARAANQRIVLPEGSEPRIIAAAAIVQERGIARCVLMGDPDEIREVAQKQGVTLPKGIELLNAANAAPSYVKALVEARRHKGMTEELALSELSDPIMIGTMMMSLGEADGLVSGAVHTTAHTIRPALQIIKTVPGCKLVSSVFFMLLPEQVLVFGDCAVNPNPNAEQLADIAVQSADSAIAFGITPRVAMLSYSTGESGSGEDVEKVKRATELARALRPGLPIDGPLQYDAAVMPDVARQKAPRSEVAGRATVFIFPDLNSGNVTYKAVQRSANVVSIGPMLQGLARPVNDLSRGCLVEDIVFTIALTAIQGAQVAKK